MNELSSYLTILSHGSFHPTSAPEIFAQTCRAHLHAPKLTPRIRSPIKCPISLARQVIGTPTRQSQAMSPKLWIAALTELYGRTRMHVESRDAVITGRLALALLSVCTEFLFCFLLQHILYFSLRTKVNVSAVFLPLLYGFTMIPPVVRLPTRTRTVLEARARSTAR